MIQSCVACRSALDAPVRGVCFGSVRWVILHLCSPCAAPDVQVGGRRSPPSPDVPVQGLGLQPPGCSSPGGPAACRGGLPRVLLSRCASSWLLGCPDVPVQGALWVLPGPAPDDPVWGTGLPPAVDPVQVACRSALDAPVRGGRFRSLLLLIIHVSRLLLPALPGCPCPGRSFVPIFPLLSWP